MLHREDNAPRPTGQACPNCQQFQPLSPSEQRAAILLLSTATHYFFDKLRFRDSVTPDADLIAFLRLNAKSVTVKPDKLRFDHEIIITVPNPAALQRIAAQRYWRLVEIEIAREVCFADWVAPVALHHFTDALLVHHARRRQRIITHKSGETITPEEAEAIRLLGLHTTTTGGRNGPFKLTWYSGLSKIDGSPCFKFEGRIRGAAQLRRFGIHSNADLAEFNIAAFIDDHENLAVPDPVKVARAHLRDHPQSMPQPSRHYPDPLRRLGNILIRALSYYPDRKKKGTTFRHHFRSSQCFVTEVHSSASLTRI